MSRPARSAAIPCLLVLLLGLPGWAPSAAQSVPTTFNYQGRLLQNTSDQDAVTGSIDVVFSIWSGPASDGGAVQLWSESWTGVTLSNGIFSVLLGSNGSPLVPADFQGDSSLFLQLVVDGETLLPRQQLGSAPFAIVDEPANELQDVELAGNSLGLTRSSVTVDLAPYLDDTDQQDLSLAGTSLGLTNDPTPVDLSGFLDNTDVQTLALAGNTLTISGSGSSVDLSSVTDVADLASALGVERTVFVSSTTSTAALGGLSGADSQCQSLADAAGLSGTFMAWLSDSSDSAADRLDHLGSFVRVDGTTIAGSWTDLTDGTLAVAINRTEQNALVSSAPGAVWTATATDGTLQGGTCGNWTSAAAASSATVGDHGATGATWTANGTSPCSASLRLYCVERSFTVTDNQRLTLAGTDLELTSDDGTDVVSLAAFLDNTDDQALSISGNTLQLTSDHGTDTVSLAGYLDNTDSQTLSLSGSSTLGISGSGSTVSLARFFDNTDNQTLSLSGSTLRISNSGTTVDLSSFLDNTDNQTLSISGNNLSISGSGSTVSLSGFLQNLNGVLTQGNDAGNHNITNVATITATGLDCPNCIHTDDIDQDEILGNDITDNIYIVHIDCNGSCADMSMKEACNVIENLRGLSYETELIGVSCMHGVPSTTGNQFVACNDGTTDIGDNECRAFNLRNLGDIPCVDGDGTDAIVTCLETDIPK